MLNVFDVLALLFVYATLCLGGLLGSQYGIAGMILGTILGFLVGNALTQFRYCLIIIIFDICSFIRKMTKKFSNKK
jgi:hypothetical protein